MGLAKSLSSNSERLLGKNVSRESTKGGHLRALMKELDGQAGGKEKSTRKNIKNCFQWC